MEHLYTHFNCKTSKFSVRNWKDYFWSADVRQDEPHLRIRWKKSHISLLFGVVKMPKNKNLSQIAQWTAQSSYHIATKDCRLNLTDGRLIFVWACPDKSFPPYVSLAKIATLYLSQKMCTSVLKIISGSSFVNMYRDFIEKESKGFIDSIEKVNDLSDMRMTVCWGP